MAKKSPDQETREPMVLTNCNQLRGIAQKLFPPRFPGRPVGLVCVKDWVGTELDAFDYNGSFSRLLVVFEGHPIKPTVVQRWREWAMKRKTRDLRIAIIQDEINEHNLLQAIEKNCTHWNAPIPAREVPAIVKGSFVDMSNGSTAKDDHSLLTMMFGSMGEILTQLEIAAGRFKEACDEAGFNREKAKAVLGDVSKLLATKPDKAVDMPSPPTGLEQRNDAFPKVHLYGKSGVGKTLITAYLQARAGFDSVRPLRIPIPEYLGKEEALEYDLFGYAHGAYTGGRDTGDPGLLLRHMGGVVFLDEIGQANSTIQAKLLAFLDDYRVRPRGWGGDPFHCPVLIVAATNLTLQQLAEKNFAPDLLARFTDLLTIPPLRDRMSDIEYILDCLLQRNSLNRDGFVTEIGAGALEAIKTRTFEAGNFRELEDWFRKACETAAREGRPYLVAEDVER